MRLSTFKSLSLLFSVPATAFLVIPDTFRDLPAPFAALVEPNPMNHQNPLSGPGLVQPPSASSPGDDQDTSSGGGADSSLTISDILPKTRQINIFASLTRDVSAISGRLESGNDNSTLLAPLNSAMQALPRKPWEDRPDDKSGVSAASHEDKAAKNLQRFVEEHVVPKSPWEEGEKVNTLGGQKLWWESKDGKKVVMPHGLVVDGVLGRVGNGEIWAVKGVVNYQ